MANHILVGTYGVLDNAGTLGGQVNVAIEGDSCDSTFATCPTVLNHDGGTIRASDHAVQMNSLGYVTNSSGGLIEGGNAAVWLAAGSVTNDGPGSIIRSASGTAIDVEHGQGIVTNTGGALISSGGPAIVLAYGGSVTNGIGSTIETQGTSLGNCGGSRGCAIYVGSDLITGLTLSNQGTILGNVEMVSTAHNVTTLWAGSVIQGDLDMGTNQGSFFTLDGGAGTVQRYSDAVTGTTTYTGLLIKAGDGSWIIDSDDLSNVAHAEVRGGTLQIGEGGTIGQVGSATSGDYSPISIQIATGASLVFDRSDDVIYQGYVSPLDSGGGGTIVQKGAGTVTLTDARWVNGLALVVDQGGFTLGDGRYQNDYLRPVSITDNGVLAVDTDGQLFLESVISGSGSLIKRGPGILSLDENNTYVGPTVVEAGTLRSTDLLPGDVTVDSGAVLQGAAYSGTPPGLPGTAGNLSNSGRIEVRGGDARIGGSYTNTSTGTLAISLGSKLDVAGTATLNGGTLEITGADGGYVSNSHTNVLTATGGVSGTFDQLVKGSGVVFTATTINYDSKSVWLDTTGLNVTVAAAGDGVTYTPASMGSAVRVQGAFDLLDQKIASGKLDGVPSEFVKSAGQFQQAPDLLAAQASLESLSGELHAVSSAMTFEAIDASNRAVSEHFDKLVGTGTNKGTWTQNLSLGGDMARPGFSGVDFQLSGWLVGNDRSIGETGVSGFAFGQSQGLQRMSGRIDHDTSRNSEAMLYAGRISGNSYLLGRVGFGHFRQNVTRQVLLGYSAQSVGAQYDGGYQAVYGESGMRVGNRDSQLTPFLNVQYSRVDRNGFAEQGAGGFGLRSSAQSVDRWQAGLGLRAKRHWALSHGRSLDINAHAQWQRTVASHGDMFNASFVGLEQWQPLLGVGLSRYSNIFGLGMDAALWRHTALNLSYDYERGQRNTAQSLMARLNVAF
ncbi:MAG: autotransporter outer membrane beta-barrel domain-containing protein [Dyella sp.]|uniref:autotransporter outer membrane beta-barrel domain-containing protein n=1 Tax=Dyella sp. TaxID=1869338 RepID=UPI003F813379